MTDIQRLASGSPSTDQSLVATPGPVVPTVGALPSLPAWVDAGPQAGVGVSDENDVSRLPLGLSRHDLDDLVDSVVERIEQRVVDELERRGRHFTPGAF